MLLVRRLELETFEALSTLKILLAFVFVHVSAPLARIAEFCWRIANMTHKYRIVVLLDMAIKVPSCLKVGPAVTLNAHQIVCDAIVAMHSKSGLTLKHLPTLTRESGSLAFFSLHFRLKIRTRCRSGRNTPNIIVIVVVVLFLNKAERLRLN